MKMKTLSSFAALLISVSMLAGCGNGAGGNGDEKTDDAQSEATTASTSAAVSVDAEEEDSLKSMTSLEFVRAMGNGINLGNTLEAYNHAGYVGGANPDGLDRKSVV